MQAKTIKEIGKEYELELDKIASTIKKQKARLVLLQFPDGMKPYATAIAEELGKISPKTEFLIWLGSCFGACDVPQTKGLKPEIGLIVQFGHSKNFHFLR
ncbi:diphthamide synthesis protein [Candidatus Pacearchaeota archaeon]|nr:diphthamide synthesis protein [Candidatus Pacearchaeota archaeon]